MAVRLIIRPVLTVVMRRRLSLAGRKNSPAVATEVGEGSVCSTPSRPNRRTRPSVEATCRLLI